MIILKCTGCDWEISADHSEQYKPCIGGEWVEVRREELPFEARSAMQKAIWAELPNNEWTTWSDSCMLAEIAAEALVGAGWKVVRDE